MKKQMRFFTTGLFFLLPHLIFSQTPATPWIIGIHAGISEYRGEMGNGFFDMHLTSSTFYNDEGIQIQKNLPGMLGISATRYINPKFDISTQIHHGEWGYYNASKTKFFFRSFNLLTLDLRYKLPGFDNSALTPYLIGGIGYRNISIYDSKRNFQHEAVFPLGAGISYRLNKLFVLNLQSNIGFTSNDLADGIKSTNTFGRDQYWNHSLGISIIPGELGIRSTKSLKSRCARF